LRLVDLALAGAGIADTAAAAAGTAIPLSFVGVTTGLLAVVLGAAKLADLIVRIGGGGATGLGIPHRAGAIEASSGRNEARAPRDRLRRT
jgi:hypothetical protein